MTAHGTQWASTVRLEDAILYRLAESPASYSELAAGLGVACHRLDRPLRRLRELEVVRIAGLRQPSRRGGRPAKVLAVMEDE